MDIDLNTIESPHELANFFFKISLLSDGSSFKDDQLLKREIYIANRPELHPDDYSTYMKAVALAFID